MDIYLQAGKDKANLIFFARGWFKTNLNKKVGGVKAIFFSVTSVPITFFIKLEGKAGRGGVTQAN